MATNKTYPNLTADEAAALVPNGAMVAVSGFTPAGAPNASVPGGIQEVRMRLLQWESRICRSGPAYILALRSLGYVAAILDGNNLLDFKRGKFSDPVVEGLK